MDGAGLVLVGWVARPLPRAAILGARRRLNLVSAGTRCRLKMLLRRERTGQAGTILTKIRRSWRELPPPPSVLLPGSHLPAHLQRVAFDGHDLALPLDGAPAGDLAEDGHQIALVDH